ncbi:sensor histidine kinase [Tepidamorphus sp. 3E244]|uniref:sensor histidine kinase n=1 Tax=Tepidamorphus sp. 3E244 TaxID=3385498 RepID=UPI0038FCD208
MNQSFQFLVGGGEMGEAVRAHDWMDNPLGPIETWPSALKIALGMALNSRFPKCVVWGTDLITLHNDAFTPILGEKPSALGRSFRDVWSEVWAEIGPIAERAFAGEPTFIENFPLIINRHGYPEQAYFTFCYSPIRDEDGIVRGMMDTVIETTATVEAEEHARLLSAELGHRIKNTLTIVSTIVRQTLNAAETKKEAGVAVAQRIDALAKAQSVLTGSRRADGDLSEVVDHALRPFRSGDDQFVIDGPPVRLSAGQVFTMMLALNELATNALKYGALSHADGKVHLSWSAGRPNTADPFRMVWAEVNGPPVHQGSRKGFGSRILEQVVPLDFMGESVLSRDSTGVRFELKTQMNRLGH